MRTLIAIIDFPMCIMHVALLLAIGTLFRCVLFLSVPLAIIGYTYPFRWLWTVCADTEDCVRDAVLGLFSDCD